MSNQKGRHIAVVSRGTPIDAQIFKVERIREKHNLAEEIELYTHDDAMPLVTEDEVEQVRQHNYYKGYLDALHYLKEYFDNNYYWSLVHAPNCDGADRCEVPFGTRCTRCDRVKGEFYG